MFHKILLCSDGSDRSLTAAEAAAELAKTHRAHLTLLHVCQVPSIEAPFPGAPSFVGPTVDAYVKDMHNAVIRRTLPVIKQAAVCCDIVEEVGNPADIIARVANQQEFDLVVLGSRGVSADKAEKLGSVCHRVIHEAFCPVLVVR
jgi:nucleotide-binding universal stress UspA family protein